MKNVKLMKYPKTFHLPWSKGIQSDDKVLHDLSCFVGQEIVVLEKLDGENTNLYSNYSHARSLDSVSNHTRSWVSGMHSAISHMIPDNIHLSGENLWGQHSIRYEDDTLDGYFYLFAVWEHFSHSNDVMSLSYDNLIDYSIKLDLPTPKLLYRGVFDEKALNNIANDIDTNVCEGYVIRLASSFNRDDMKQSVAKFVREGHVQPNADHWLKNVKQNGKLKSPCKPAFMNKNK